jgi:8-oxo-dGTP pyrophosphatase MutT (NUDIX family)
MEERSAGAVLFYGDEPDKRRFLLLLNGGRWDFSKGNVETGESELQTVIREVGEETGLTDISLIPGFRRVIEYSYRREGRKVHKQVVYLLARTEDCEVKISQEHQSFGWFPYAEALQRASYDNSRATLQEAEEFIRTASSRIPSQN